MQDDVAFSRALEKIYAATLSESFWPDALRTVSGLFDSDFAHFEVLEKKTGRPVFFRNVGATAESLDLYVAHYAETSPRAAHGKDKPEGYVSYDHQLLSEAEIGRDEFYADFLQPQGYKYFIASNLLNNEDLFSVFSVQRHLSQSHVDSEEIALMERLTPHLSQALKIHLRVMGLEGRESLPAPLFENSATGVIVLNADGTILRFNPAAERMISDPANGLNISGKRLSFTADTVRGEAETLLANAIATASGEGHRPAGALALPRADGLPLNVIAVPLPRGPEAAEGLLNLTGAPAVAVLICDPNSHGSLPDDMLRAMFGLTPAECRVTRALLAGQTANGYAATSGVGIRTVRTHISRVLNKTGARNQIELVRLLGSVPYEFEDRS